MVSENERNSNTKKNEYGFLLVYEDLLLKDKIEIHLWMDYLNFLL